MSVITYIARDRGKLVSGHSDLTEYSIEVPISSYNTTRENKGALQRSLSGVPFKTLHRIESSVSLSTILLHKSSDATTIAEIEEFLSSVAAGESFLIDAYGSLLSPDDPKEYTINGSSSVSVVEVLFYQYSFKAVEL